MRLLAYFFLILSCWYPFVSVAYPWSFFKEVKRDNYLELDFQSSFFINNKFSSSVGGQLEFHSSKADIDLSYYYSVIEKKPYFRFGELSLTYPLTKSTQLVLGFRDFVWSESDRYWNHGRWQPRYLIDVFRPLETSLPGIYLDQKFQDTTSVSFYYSHFYLPDIIPLPELKDGVVFTKNPFFESIYSTKNINWDVQSLKKVQLASFFKPLYAFHVQHQVSHSELFFSYAYKPMNQLQFFIYTEGVNLSSKETENLSISKLDYAVLYHHLLTVETEIHVSDVLSVFASILYENPEAPAVDNHQQWLSDQPEPKLIASALIYFKEEIKDTEKVTLALGYTKVFENNSPQKINNLITEDLEFLFNSDLDWKHAISWSMEYWTKSFLEGFQFYLRLNYALDNQFYLVAVESSVYVLPYLKVYVSGDLVFQSNKLKEKSRSNSSIHRYKDLSRVLTGVKYVF